MCRVDGSDPADVYRTDTRIARTEHRCGECCRQILKGEPYDYITIIADGYASVHKVCSHCAVLAAWLMKECDGTVIGELIEDIEEHAREYERTDLMFLAACARSKWAWPEEAQSEFSGVPIPLLPAGLSPPQTPKVG